jgi:hypothetical protein
MIAAEMSAIRTKAMGYLSRIPFGPGPKFPMTPAQYIGSKDHPQEFQRLTGVTQKMLQAQWDIGKNYTTCNAFTGVYGHHLGDTVGCFHALFPSDYLKGDSGTQPGHKKRKSMAHAWVKSTVDGPRPKYGDMYQIAGEHVKDNKGNVMYDTAHVGIVMEFNDDGTWFHADSGQGGKGAGQDRILKQISPTPFDYKKLRGWIDLDLYFGNIPDPTIPPPPWLGGWWVVKWRGTDYYYYFDGSNTVTWTQWKPDNLEISPIPFPIHTGNLLMTGADSFKITWNDSGSIENHSLAVGSKDEIVGLWNSKENLSGVRLTSLFL